MKKIISVAFVFVICMSLFVSCAAQPVLNESDAIKKGGSLVIGYGEFVPMNYTENGTLKGFDTELAQAVCDSMGLKAEFKEISWSEKEEKLVGGEVDVLWSGLAVTDERKNNMSFTQPYLNVGQIIVIRSSDSDRFVKTEDFRGACIAVENGTTSQAAIMDSDLKSCAIKTCDTTHDALLALESGEADAAVMDYVSAMSYIKYKKEFSSLSVVDGIVLATEQYAVGTRSGSDIAEKINDALTELKKDGTVLKIASAYGIECCVA